jgi:hypothetical protein
MASDGRSGYWLYEHVIKYPGVPELARAIVWVADGRVVNITD